MWLSHVLLGNSAITILAWLLKKPIPNEGTSSSPSTNTAHAVTFDDVPGDRVAAALTSSRPSTHSATREPSRHDGAISNASYRGV